MNLEYEVRRRALGPWLNTAMLKGGVLLVAGFAVLLLPSVTLPAARVALGLGLLLSGLVDFWDAHRSPGLDVRAEQIQGVVNVALAMVVLFLPSQTLRLILLVGGVYLVVRALYSLVGAVRQVGPSRWIQLLWGIALASAALLAALAPDHLVEAIISGAAVVMVLAGGVLLAAGLTLPEAQARPLGVTSTPVLVRRWIVRQDVGDERRTEIADSLFIEEPSRVSKYAAWWVMLLLSVAIATLGVMQDSTAVVIGAMIVAPLMAPILATAAAVVNVWPARLTRSLALAIGGAAASVLLAYIIARWTPSIVPLSVNSQVTSRTSPNVLDMSIALAAGAAGAYATVASRVASSIAGVAIAVALVPPLAVVGLTLEASHFSDAWGAFLLFLTNFVSIVLAAVIVFMVTGLASLERLRQDTRGAIQVIGSFVAVALIILLPLMLTSQGLIVAAARQSSAQDITQEWVGNRSLTVQQVSVQGSDVQIELSGAGDVPSVPQLEEELSEAFGEQVEVQVELFPSVEVS